MLQDGLETIFKVKASVKLEKNMKAYADRKGVDVSTVRLTLDGSRLDRGKMIADYEEIEDNTQIDVLIEATGGSTEHSTLLLL